MPKTRRTANTQLLESLEPRTLFSNSFVGVGLAISDEVTSGYDAWAYVIDGALDTQSGDLSGSISAFGSGNPIAASSLSGRKAVDLGYGRMKVLDGSWLRPGHEPSDSGNSSFLSDKGFPVGFALSEYENDFIAGDAVLLAQRPTNATLADLQGDWQMTVVTEQSANPYVAQGRVEVNGDVIGFQASLPFVDYGFGLHIDNVDATGELHVSHWETRIAAPAQRFYLSADKSFALFVNTGSGARDSAIGVMYRLDSTVSDTQLVGTYRVGMGWSYDRNTIQSTFGGVPDGVGNGSRQIWTIPTALVLGEDHTYRFYPLDDFDHGLKGSPMVSGSWSLSQGQVTLSMNGNPALSFAVGSAGQSIFAGKSIGVLSVIAVGTRLFPKGITQDIDHAELAYADVRDSHAIIFERADDNYWREFHVEQAFPATPNDIADAEAWTDQKGTGTGDTWAVIASPSDNIVYHRNSAGTWTQLSLTLTTNNPRIVDKLQVIEAADGSSHVFGMAQNGDLLRYSRSDNGINWEFHDVTQELRTAGQAIPALVGDLTSYTTSWGALNVVGLDQAGRAWAIWWAPGLTHWYASDLSGATGQDVRFSGGLTVYLTPWDGINIAGVGTKGGIDAVWWVPSMQGQWRRDSVSDATGVSQGNLPQLAPETVTSYSTPWGGLNIAGVDARTNQVVQYWWSPASNAWAIASISAAIGRARAAIIDSLRGYAAPDGSMNLIARYQPGDYDDHYSSSIPTYSAGYSNSYNAGSELMNMHFESSYGIGNPWTGTSMSGLGFDDY